MLISLQVKTPSGERATLATASAQPAGKRKRKQEGLGGFHACHLFKHAKAGVISYLKDLLRADQELHAAVLASPVYSTSRKGKRITISQARQDSVCIH